MRIPAPIVGVLAASAVVLAFAAFQELSVARPPSPDVSSSTPQPSQIRSYYAEVATPYTGASIDTVLSPALPATNGFILTDLLVTFPSGWSSGVDLQLLEGTQVKLATRSAASIGSAVGVVLETPNARLASGVPFAAGQPLIVRVSGGGATCRITICGYIW